MDWAREGGARRQFDAFVGQATELLFRTACLMTDNASDAEDLVQETFMRLARRWGFVRSMEHPFAYARRTLVNLALDGAKRRSRLRAELEAGAARPDIVDRAATEALREIDDLAEFRLPSPCLPRSRRSRTPDAARWSG